MYHCSEEIISSCMNEKKTSIMYRFFNLFSKRIKNKSSFMLFLVIYLISITYYFFGYLEIIIGIAVLFYFIFLALGFYIFEYIHKNLNNSMFLQFSDEELKRKALSKTSKSENIHDEINNNLEYYIVIELLTRNFTYFKDLDDFFIKIYESDKYYFNKMFYINNFSKSKKMFNHFANNSFDRLSLFDQDKNWIKDRADSILDKKLK